jgi:hypothetical protein
LPPQVQRGSKEADLQKGQRELVQGMSQGERREKRSLNEERGPFRVHWVPSEAL